MSDRIESLMAAIGQLNPMQSGFLAQALAQIDPSERQDLASYVDYALSCGDDLAFLAAAYDLIVKDTLREQIHFKRHGRYRHASYAEVAASVYMNPDYMAKYMHGLALTSFLWPNHAAIRRYFADTLRAVNGGTYLEVGPGHGFNMMVAMRKGGYDRYEAVDISPTSVALTRAILGSAVFGQFSGYELTVADFLAYNPAKAVDTFVMGEVLEHVEEPLRFLTKIRDMTGPAPHIFITTCINSPAFDHIYLFESVDHVESLVAAAGLRVRDRLVLPYVGMDLAASMTQRLPVNIALVLGK